MTANGTTNLFHKAAGNENISVTLDSSRAPTTSESFVSSVEKEYADLYSTYVYKNVKASSGKLCELGQCGSIEKLEESKQLKTITVNFSGEPMTLYTKYNESFEYSSFVNLSSGVACDIGGNYFKIYTGAGVVITSIVLTYNCENASATNIAPYRYLHSSDGGSSYDGYRYGEATYNTKNITAAGTYRFEGEDTDSTLWKKKGNQSPSESTEFASGGVSMRPGPYSKIVFPFLLNKPATVNITAALSKYEEWYLDDTSVNIDLWVSLDSQFLEQPHILLGHGSKSVPAAYFDWRSVDYGTFELEKGYHVVLFEYFSTAGPNLDYIDITVSNYNIAHSYTKRFTNNETIFFGGKDVLGHGGAVIPDAAWISTRLNNNGAQENVTWRDARHHSFAGYSHGTEYAIEFNLLNEADLTIVGYLASATAITLNSTTAFCFIDGVKQEVTGSITTGQGWHEWQSLTYNTYHLSSGNHKIKFPFKRIANCIGFDLTTTNMDVSFLQISNNGTYTLEAEDSRIDRSGWKIRQDFIDAHREPIEPWNNTGASPATSATSGTSLCGLLSGCQITLPITVNDACTLEYQVVCAYSDGGKAHNRLSTTVDGTTLTDYDTNVTLASGSTSTYWYWKVFKAGTITLAAGTHTIILTLVSGSINIDGFRFVITNYGA